jgi:uncharacterized protein
MLALRPNCECCDRDLPPESRDAMMCSFECTFCKSCAEGVLKGRCPNCGGELVRRLDRAQGEGRWVRGGVTRSAHSRDLSPSP